MKKLVFIFSLIFLFTSCATIDERYTGKRIRVEPEEYNDYYSSSYHSPYYYDYRPSYYRPLSWTGFYWWNPYFYWNPFSYYGFFNSYYGYYPGYYSGWGYPYYRSYRYGRSVITSKQLRKGTIRRVSSRRIRKISGRTSSTGSSGRIRNTGRTRSTVSRSSSSARSRATTSSRGSSSKVKKK